MATTQTPRIRLGDLLVLAGAINEMQLKAALMEQKKWGGKLGDILVRMNFLSEELFVKALSKQLNIPMVDLSKKPSPQAISKLDLMFVESNDVFPYMLQDEGKTLILATSDPTNVGLIDFVRAVSRCRVLPYLASASAIRSLISEHYRPGEEITDEDIEPMEVLTNADQHNPSSRPASIPPPAPLSASMPAFPPPSNIPVPSPQLVFELKDLVIALQKRLASIESTLSEQTVAADSFALLATDAQTMMRHVEALQKHMEEASAFQSQLLKQLTLAEQHIALLTNQQQAHFLDLSNKMEREHKAFVALVECLTVQGTLDARVLMEKIRRNSESISE